MVNLTTGNLFEAVHRAAKLRRMLDTSDEIARERGLDPKKDAARIFDEMTAEDFKAIVRRSGVKPPSPFTTECFLRLLKGQAEERS